MVFVSNPASIPTMFKISYNVTCSPCSFGSWCFQGCESVHIRFFVVAVTQSSRSTDRKLKLWVASGCGVWEQTWKRFHTLRQISYSSLTIFSSNSKHQLFLWKFQKTFLRRSQHLSLPLAWGVYTSLTRRCVWGIWAMPTIPQFQVGIRWKTQSARWVLLVSPRL